MLTLAFDTSSAQGGVAVLDKNKILSRLSWERQGSHGELLTPAIQKALDDAGVAMRNIETLAIGNGPGSFTGVRVAVNAARSLSFATGVPIAVFDSAEILVGGVPDRDLEVLTLINAQKNLLFVSSFAPSGASWERRLPLQAMNHDTLASLVSGSFFGRESRCLAVGDGYAEFAAQLPEPLRARLLRRIDISDFPRAEVVGRLAWESCGQRPTFGWNDLQALYIKASAAEEKLEGSRHPTVRRPEGNDDEERGSIK